MTRTTPPMGLVALAAVLSLAPWAELRAQGPDGELSRIQAVLDQQVVAWNKGDLDGFLKGYWESPDLVFQSGGDRVRGFEQTRDRYRRRYQAEGRAMGKLAFSDLQTEILGAGDEAAFTRGRWELTMPDGKKIGGLFTLIFRKVGGEWKIVHDHTSVADSPKPPAPG